MNNGDWYFVLENDPNYDGVVLATFIKRNIYDIENKIEDNLDDEEVRFIENICSNFGEFEQILENNVYGLYQLPGDIRKGLMALGLVELEIRDEYTPDLNILVDSKDSEQNSPIEKDGTLDFRTNHKSNPSLNPADYYFQMYEGCALMEDPGCGTYQFAITPKEYFDLTGYLYDSMSVPQPILPIGFAESMESDYEYSGNHQQGRQDLLNAGFVEKKMF